jgi:hypothetical protein
MGGREGQAALACLAEVGAVKMVEMRSNVEGWRDKRKPVQAFGVLLRF